MISCCQLGPPPFLLEGLRAEGDGVGCNRGAFYNDDDVDDDNDDADLQAHVHAGVDDGDDDGIKWVMMVVVAVTCFPFASFTCFVLCFCFPMLPPVPLFSVLVSPLLVFARNIGCLIIFVLPYAFSRMKMEALGVAEVWRKLGRNNSQQVHSYEGVLAGSHRHTFVRMCRHVYIYICIYMFQSLPFSLSLSLSLSF